MTREDALYSLSMASASSEASRVNKGISQANAIEIIRKSVFAQSIIGEIPEWLEKRVKQVSQNRKRPA